MHWSRSISLNEAGKEVFRVVQEARFRKPSLEVLKIVLILRPLTASEPTFRNPIFVFRNSSTARKRKLLGAECRTVNSERIDPPIPAALKYLTPPWSNSRSQEKVWARYRVRSVR